MPPALLRELSPHSTPRESRISNLPVSYPSWIAHHQFVHAGLFILLALLIICAGPVNWLVVCSVGADQRRSGGLDWPRQSRMPPRLETRTRTALGLPSSCRLIFSLTHSLFPPRLNGRLAKRFVGSGQAGFYRHPRHGEGYSVSSSRISCH